MSSDLTNTAARTRQAPAWEKNPLIQWLVALPAAVALFLTLMTFAMVALGTATPDLNESKERAAAALRHHHFKEAALWARHALQYAPGEMEVRMQLVRAYAALGNRDGQLEQLKQLAPDDRALYAPAHLERARWIMANGEQSSAALALANRCLDFALQAERAQGTGAIAQDDVLALRAEIEATRGEWKQALATAKRVSKPSAATLMLMANAMYHLGRAPEAATTADAAVAQLDQSDAASSLDERLLRLTIRATAWLLKGEPGKALEVLRAVPNDPAQPLMQARQVDLYGKVAHFCREGPRKDSRLWLEAIAGALTLAPNDLELTAELIAGTSLWLYQPGFSERAAACLADGKLQGLRELLAGLEKMQLGATDEAFQHFERGYGLLPDNPVLANNLAAILGTRPVGSDPARALVIIDGVLEKSPNLPSFLDTKGQILLRMGRNAEALLPLEAALSVQPSPGAHLILAEAYSRLGKHETAEVHRQAAKQK